MFSKEGHQKFGGLSLLRGNNRRLKDAAHNPNNRITIGALIHVKTRSRSLPLAAPATWRYSAIRHARGQCYLTFFLDGGEPAWHVEHGLPLASCGVAAA